MFKNIELQTKLTRLENSRGRIKPENVTESGVQVDDTVRLSFFKVLKNLTKKQTLAKTTFQAFTRKKAFDFYIDEVKRDAHKLLGKSKV